MVPYIGEYLLVGATGFTVFSLVAYVLAWKGNKSYANLGRTLFSVNVVAISLALAALVYLILTHDFRVAYVYSYSSTDLPLYFLISSLWGGQEGTFLLWIFLAGLMGLVMSRKAGQFENGNMVFLNLFVLSILIILLKKSPFAFMPVFLTEGAGLNPLLQNYWMTIHPPVMFVGFAATVIPFCFGMTALVERKYQLWSEAARRWTIFAWVSLGVALVMGGYWAYETLGWGGFWAWDPVENASLIPWLFLTAQIHTLFIKRQRRGLLRFSLVVVLLSFWSVMYGTFLTRSGILANFSVHSFVDLGINNYLAGGLLFFVFSGLGMVIWRWRDISPEPSYNSVNSRSYMVTLGILVTALGGVLVLAGTSMPLLSNLYTEPYNVDMSYYFKTMTPVGIAVLLLIALFPAYRWNKGVSRPVLLASGGVGLVVTIGLVVAFGVTTQILYLLLFGTAAAALVTNGWVTIQSWRKGNFQPGYLSHVGAAIALAGAGTSAGFATGQMVTLPQTQQVEALGYNLEFVHMADTEKGFDCHVKVEKGNEEFLAVLPHEFPKNSEGVMKKPHVESYLAYDLYLSPISLEQPQGGDPGTLVLMKGETRSVGPYRVTFLDFDVSGHGGEEDSEVKAQALLTIVSSGYSEDVAPYLMVGDSSVVPVPVTFDNDRTEVSIANIDPGSGAVQLTFSGEKIPQGGLSTASLVIEVSEKPLISLFWLGTIIAFLAGILSIVKRQRQKDKSPAATTPISDKETSRNVA